MNDKIKNKHIDELFETILQLRSSEECYMFFEDVCTVSELNAIAQRLQVAKMLKDGCKYSKIINETGAGTATISRVNRCLNYGADGYNLVIDRIKKKENN